MDTKTLIKECSKNNRGAQKHLYNTYADVMMGVCYRYSKSVADAEDILQEGFVKVFSNLHQFKQEGELEAWIRRIMVHASLDYLQKHNRYRKDLNFDQLPMHPIAAEDPAILMKQCATRTICNATETLLQVRAKRERTKQRISDVLERLDAAQVRIQETKAEWGVI